MIIGVGIDIVDVADMQRRIERSNWDRVFSPAEMAYANERPRKKAEILAARWAAKEAFFKAVGSGIRAELPLTEVEVVRVAEGTGKRAIRLGDTLRTLLPPNIAIHLSMTHTATSAAAVIVLEEVR